MCRWFTLFSVGFYNGSYSWCTKTYTHTRGHGVVEKFSPRWILFSSFRLDTWDSPTLIFLVLVRTIGNGCNERDLEHVLSQNMGACGVNFQFFLDISELLNALKPKLLCEEFILPRIAWHRFTLQY